MLYLTTRDKLDAFTAVHALREDRAKCGGFYVPYRLPTFSKEEILALQSLSFGQRIAKMLNCFFNASLTGADVEFAIGRRPVRVAAMSHKIAVLEAWHNHDGDFDFLVAKLYRLIAKEAPKISGATTWFRIAVRIAVLFAAFADLLKTDIVSFSRPVDVSAAVGDFISPMAIWYARKMGLPIVNIVVSCSENSAVWDFLNNGILSGTEMPAVEILLFERFGFHLTQSFVQCSLCGKSFSISEDKLEILRRGMFCAVVRQHRIESIIQNQFNTSQYRMDQNTAAGFGGLQDYRATQSETRAALILSDKNPQT